MKQVTTAYERRERIALAYTTLKDKFVAIRNEWRESNEPVEKYQPRITALLKNYGITKVKMSSAPFGFACHLLDSTYKFSVIGDIVTYWIIVE